MMKEAMAERFSPGQVLLVISLSLMLWVAIWLLVWVAVDLNAHLP